MVTSWIGVGRVPRLEGFQGWKGSGVRHLIMLGTCLCVPHGESALLYTSCFTVPANRNLSRAGAGARARTRARTRARVRAKVHVRACMCNSCNSCFTLRVKHGNPRLRPFNCWWVPARSSMRLPTLLKHYRASSELLARNAPWVVYIVARKNCAPTNSF